MTGPPSMPRRAASPPAPNILQRAITFPPPSRGLRARQASATVAATPAGASTSSATPKLLVLQPPMLTAP